MTSNDNNDQATQAATLAAEREREERFTHWLENAGGMWIAGMVALKAEPTPAPFESDEAMTSFIQDRFFDTLAHEPEVSFRWRDCTAPRSTLSSDAGCRKHTSKSGGR